MDTISVVDVAERCEAEFDRLKVARPALLSRISRAENILVTHLSCPKASIIKPRVRGEELVGYLVKGSSASGAVYRVEAGTFSCSCPDYHRSGLAGCKHGIVCYVLGRAFRPAPILQVGRRCAAEPKMTRHGVAKETTVPGDATSAPVPTGNAYGDATCSRCFDGLTYDGQAEEWAACERCSGTGRVVAFLYEHAERRLVECVGCGERYPHRELIEVTEDHESLTFFPGDRLCVRECASAHGVL